MSDARSPDPGRECTSMLRVRYAETDKMGVVYYANYFVWFEVGRCDLLRTFGSSYRDIENAGISLPVIEAHCEYRQPAHYDDEVAVRTRANVRSPVRLAFDYQISRPADGALIAEGRTVHAAIGADGRPRRLPQALKAYFI
jgi:acyl-CoA thioester hydrolase